ncbi:MAG: tetratricopeptide repeat protein [Candidatus Lokiarchaeota archaeon]|nr:tetratricopeptide repeat protein [Candidatus Lokiarchaeota archaeon]
MEGRWTINSIIKNQYEVRDIKGGPGKSGAGIVYLCYDRIRKKPIALKTFQEHILEDKKAIERFIHEANIWIDLENHPNIVKAYVVEIIEYRPYLVLEYVDGDDTFGPTLRDWINHRGLDLITSLSFALQFCEGMIYAEKKLKEKRKSFVHRDIKPENILINRDKVIKITDFGIAKTFLSREKQISNNTIDNKNDLTVDSVGGTPPYMSPEQWDGNPTLDIRADIYSFGCVLYEMISYHPFFQLNTRDIREYYYHHKNSIPRGIPNIPRKFNNLILKCLEKDRERRYNNFKSLRENLFEIYKHLDFNLQTQISKSKNLVTPNDPDIIELLNKAYSLDNTGRFLEALKIYDQILSIDPKIEKAWVNKGFALEKLNRDKEALYCYDKALELNPKNEKIFNNKAHVLQKMDKHLEAIESSNNAIRLNPEYSPAWNNKGFSLYKIGKFNEAISCFNKSLEINPRITEVWLNKGRILGDLDKYQEAIECYNSALDIDKRSAPIWRSKGFALGKLGRFKDEIACLDKAIEIDPKNASAYHNKGFALVQLKKYWDGIYYYDRAIMLDPSYTSAFKNKGATLIQLGKIREALDCYDKALELEPQDAESWLIKGHFSMVVGQYQEAAESFKKHLNYLKVYIPDHTKKINQLIIKCELM